jgi:release factor glutamine methyltransferase
MSLLIQNLLQQAQAAPLARIDAQMLMLHACGQSAYDRAWLLAHAQDALTPEQTQRWMSFCTRRLGGEPVAYITGYKEFYGLRLAVSKDVLDPRDDTETLVDWALALIPLDSAFRVLDLGTGSGAIALALKSQRPLAQLTATDASSAALAVAQSNAQRLELDVRFVQADAGQANWLSALPRQQFDLIVSNPPYIAEGDAHLSHLQHEPRMALSSGADGLEAIRSISAHAPQHLKPGGWLLLEHGFDQASLVQSILKRNGFTSLTSQLDLSQIARCTGGKIP